MFSICMQKTLYKNIYLSYACQYNIAFLTTILLLRLSKTLCLSLFKKKNGGRKLSLCLFSAVLHATASWT